MSSKRRFQLNRISSSKMKYLNDVYHYLFLQLRPYSNEKLNSMMNSHYEMKLYSVFHVSYAILLIKILVFNHQSKIGERYYLVFGIEMMKILY